MQTWWRRHYRSLLFLILAFAFLTRFYRLHLPQRYIFDEVYHAVTAKLIARNDPRAYEWNHPAPEPNTAIDWLHPPLAKYTQALGIRLFGETTFGWRVSSAVTGVLVVALTYALAQELFQKPGVALVAAGLASLDGLLLVQSRLAMNDIHVTFFILLALLTYWRFFRLRRSGQTDWWGLVLAAYSAGLAMGTKWSGLFVLLTIGLSETWHHIQVALKKDHRNQVESALRHLFLMVPVYLAILVALPLAVYGLAYSHMFLQGKDWSHFKGLHQQIWWYQNNLEATHSYQSRPLQWWLDLRPVWYHVEYGTNQIANIYAQGNPTLFWLGDVAVVVSLLSIILTSLVLQVKNRKVKRPAVLARLKKWLVLHRTILSPLSFLLLAYLMVWLPWQLSPRIMFFYHYTPAVPLLCIILAFWLGKLTELRWGKYVAGFCVVLIASTFVIWYPNWTGMLVPKKFADSVYFMLKDWK